MFATFVVRGFDHAYSPVKQEVIYAGPSARKAFEKVIQIKEIDNITCQLEIWENDVREALIPYQSLIKGGVSK